MPYAQGGTFYATLSGANSDLVQPVAFTHYPIGPLTVLLVIVGFVVNVCRGVSMTEPFPRLEKLIALLPGGLGIFLILFFTSPPILHAAIPLIGQTIALLLWSQQKNQGSYASSAFLGCMLAGMISLGTFIGISPVRNSPSDVFPGIPIFLLAIIHAIPLSVIRWKIATGLLGKLLIKSTAIAVLIPSSILAVIYFCMETSLWTQLSPLLYLSVSAFLFGIWLTHNSWARSAACGQ